MTELEIKEHNRLWYKKTYDALIEKGRQRGNCKKDFQYYTESHHVIPICMGGKDGEQVLLTAREHLIAHMLLTRIYPDSLSLFNACMAMTMKTKDREGMKLSTRTLSDIRENFSRLKKGKKWTEEQKEKFSKRRKELKLKHSEETKKKISKANKGRKNTPEQLEKQSKALKGRIITKEWREKISKTCTGKPHPHKNPTLSEEVREKKRKICEQRTRELHPNSKKVIDKDGKVFASLTECSKYYNTSRASLLYWIRNNPEKGFKFI